MKQSFLYGDKIVITGASSGIGKACASLFAQNGYTVFALSRKIEEKTEQILSGSITGIRCDVTDSVSIKKAFERIGDFGILIHSAGFGIAGAAEDTPLDMVRLQFETNYFGVLAVNTTALPILRKRGKGLIMAISSIAGRVSIPFQSHYSSTKYAIEAYMEALSMEAGSFGIKAVIIEPGDTNTAFTAKRETGLPETSIYRQKAEAAIRQMEKDEKEGKDPITVAKTALKISNKKNPPIRIAVGTSYKMLMLLRRLLPDRAVLFLLRKIYHQ